MCIGSMWQGWMEQVNGAPSQEPEPEFDRWMRHRVNVAHAKYMERTSYRLSCDWPGFSPEAIAAFVERCC